MIHHISPNWAYNGPTGGPTLGLHIKLKNDLLNYKKVRNVKLKPGKLPVLSRVNMKKVKSGRQDLNQSILLDKNYGVGQLYYKLKKGYSRGVSFNIFYV